MKSIAEEKGLTVDGFFAELTKIIVAAHDAEKRFRQRAAAGGGQEDVALELLKKPKSH